MPTDPPPRRLVAAHTSPTHTRKLSHLTRRNPSVRANSQGDALQESPRGGGAAVGGPQRRREGGGALAEEDQKLYRKYGKWQRKLRDVWALLGVKPPRAAGREGRRCVLKSKITVDDATDKNDYMPKSTVEAEYV